MVYNWQQKDWRQFKKYEETAFTERALSFMAVEYPPQYFDAGEFVETD